MTTDQTQLFLAFLRRGGTYAYYWTLDEEKTYEITRGPRKGQREKCKRTFWFPIAHPSGIPRGATEHVYFGVHPASAIPTERKGKDGVYTPRPEFTRPVITEIAAVNCLFGEFDAKDFADGRAGALAHIEQLEARPSVLIDSGGGYHAYWLLHQSVLVRDDNRATIRDLQNRWVQFVGSDEDSKDLARVLRVPGRPNVKAKYAPDYPVVTFTWCDLDRLYDLGELSLLIPAAIVPQAERPAIEFTATPGDHNAYVQAAYQGEAAAVRSAPDGLKHHTLRNAAIKLATLLWTGCITEREIEDGLQAAADQNAADIGYAHKTIADGIVYGSDPKRRRIIPERPKKSEDVEQPTEGSAAPDNRPTIDIGTIDLPVMTPQAWDALVAQNDPPILFRRAGELARLETTESGAKALRTIDDRRMLGALARAARWVRWKKIEGEFVERENLPPSAIVDDCMVNIDARVPILTRVVYAPAFSGGGLLLAEPGYHASAQIYYDPRSNATVPPVPAQPTQDDLTRARTLILDDVLGDFPFVSDADRAHAVALLLLPFVRDLISGPTPLHLIEAPTMGTGKSLLADVLLLPALGVVPSPMTEASTDEEWRKRITSTLLGAPTVAYIDNLNRTLDAGSLAAALTAQEWSDRILGKSEQVQIPVRCAWVATANNPTLSTEISRRCIRIRIDPRVDKPWQREGFKHPELRTWIMEQRSELIWAALVLCRYGLQHGTAGKPLGSYESWSNVIGRILHAADIPDFLGNLDQLYDRADVQGAAWRALLTAWWSKHQDEPQLASDLFPLVAEAEADQLVNGKDERGQKKSFGKALLKVLDRVFTVETESSSLRLQLATAGERHKTKLWKLALVEKGGIVGLGGLISSQLYAREGDYIKSSRADIEKNPLNPPNPPAQNGNGTDAYRPIIAARRNISHESQLRAMDEAHAAAEREFARGGGNTDAE